MKACSRIPRFLIVLATVELSGAAATAFGQNSDSRRDLLRAIDELEGLYIEEGKSLLRGDTAQAAKYRASQLEAQKSRPVLQDSLLGGGGVKPGDSALFYPCLDSAVVDTSKKYAVELVDELRKALKQKRKADECFFRTNLEFNAYLQRYAMFQKIRQRAYVEHLLAEAESLRLGQEALKAGLEKHATMDYTLSGIILAATAFSAIFLALYR